MAFLRRLANWIMILMCRLLAETMKISYQNKALYCYIIMTLWIFFIVAATYKYVVVGEENISKHSAWHMNTKSDTRFHRIVTRSCNPVVNISRGTEGMVNEEQWQLQGILIITRHGDRGPLTHIRHGDTLPCDKVLNTQLLQSYEDYVKTASVTGRASWVQNPGPFHNFPSLPVDSPSTSCALGQLTLLGVHQMLTLGRKLREAYFDKLGWSVDMENINLNGKRPPGDVVAYSTRYRRTFQSAMALLWAFLPPKLFASRAAQLRESHSIYFCFKECACPATSHLAKKVTSETERRLQLHPTITDLVKQMSEVLFEAQEKDPEIIKDALLAFICHDVPLPCIEKPSPDPSYDHKGRPLKKYLHKRSVNNNVNRNLLEVDLDRVNSDLDYINNQLDFDGEFGRKARDIISSNRHEPKNGPVLDFDAQMEREKLLYYQQKYVDNAGSYDDLEFVKKHFDHDFNFKADDKLLGELGDSESTTHGRVERVCIKRDNLISLFAFIDWNYRQNMKSANNKRWGILSAYGLIHNIVKNMIKMISENKPRFVYYSAHDKTLMALLLALGIGEYHQHSIYYASRMIFEVYRKRDVRGKAEAQDFYFRLVFNGADVTNFLSFCKNARSVATDQNKGSFDSFLCPIENIVRFIHDDYFYEFNTSNFKDSCVVYGTERKYF